MSGLLGFLSRFKLDVALALLLALAGVIYAWRLQAAINPVLYTQDGQDVHFESDAYRGFESMLERLHPTQNRANVHPLFPAWAIGQTLLLQKLGVDRAGAVHAVIALTAAQFFLLLFAVQRVWGLPRLDAIVFTLLAGVSAFSIFWFAVPETYGAGAVSICFALLIAGITVKSGLHWAWHALSGLMTLAFTTTNFAVGGAATFFTQRLTRTVLAMTVAIVAMVVLALAQKQLVPHAGLPWEIAEEKQFANTGGPNTDRATSGGPLAVSQVFFGHAISMVPPKEIQKIYPQYDPAIPPKAKPRLTVQPVPLFAGTWAGDLTLLLWLGLFAAGIVALFTARISWRLRAVLAASLLSQYLLHLLYGIETFLYSLHYGPLMVLVAALTSLTGMRKVTLPLALVLVPLLAYHNGQLFAWTADWHADFGPDKIVDAPVGADADL